MKKKIKKDEKNNSLRMLVFYGILVFAVILIALLFRAFVVIEESKFDGQHQFTLAVGKTDDRVLVLISFEPLSYSLSVLTLPTDQKLSFSSLNRAIGIIPDGFVKTTDNLDLERTTPSILQSLIFNSKTVYGHITFYDLFRFWLYSNKISAGTINNQKIPVLSDVSAVDKTVMLMFGDSVLASENVSLQIVNATRESGLGGRLARVISNLGGNVVSVQTSTTTEPSSKIQYYEADTYTLRKLKSLLPYRGEKLRNKTIAEIVIIIGEDNKGTKLF